MSNNTKRFDGIARYSLVAAFVYCINYIRIYCCCCWRCLIYTFFSSLQIAPPSPNGKKFTNFWNGRLSFGCRWFSSSSICRFCFIRLGRAYKIFSTDSITQLLDIFFLVDIILAFVLWLKLWWNLVVYYVACSPSIRMCRLSSVNKSLICPFDSDLVVHVFAFVFFSLSFFIFRMNVSKWIGIAQRTEKIAFQFRFWMNEKINRKKISNERK